MTLIGAILNKVLSKDSINKKYYSPPPELETKILVTKFNRAVNKYNKVQSRIDTKPPQFNIRNELNNFRTWTNNVNSTFKDNIKLLAAIQRVQLLGGKVDCYWKVYPKRNHKYYEKRCQKLSQLEKDNKILHNIILNANPKVQTTKSLLKDWDHNRSVILELATKPFILFPSVPSEIIEDAAFAPPPGVTRIRLRLKIGIKNASPIGEMKVELFNEICPLTCKLFLELVKGDEVGFSYIGTRFFTKVPGLYWSGGDVIYDNGFGCYAQVGRNTPIGAENYHFSHSMPGLLSMRMTCDNEMCGSFNITFKSMPQFDLNNVVFARIIRPCRTFEAIRSLGSALSTKPVIEILNTRIKQNGAWVYGKRNTQLRKTKLFKRYL